MRAFLPLLLALLLTSASASTKQAPTIRAQPVKLDGTQPNRRTVGLLRYLGGWQLTSGREDFGGLSSMMVDKGHMLALSDTGMAYRFRFDPGQIMPATFVPLPTGPGKTNRKQDRDSESMIVDRATGTLWVGFEYWNEIWRYAPNFAAVEANSQPVSMSRWPANSGPEAMVRLHDGRFLVFCEKSEEGSDTTDLIRFDGDASDPATTAERLRYRPPSGYAPTDADVLPDGRLLVLHRRFSILGGFSAVLSLLDPTRTGPDGVLEGQPIARFDPPMTVDNMEALSIEQEPDGKLIVWIASDDNFNPFERTLLLKFLLDPSQLPK